MSEKLARSLKLPHALAIVIGSMIGTGVFLKTSTMAILVGSPMMVMAAWIAAGVLSLIGAFTYAHLGTIYPRAGGEYIYFKEAYGDLTGFLYGWMRFWIASPGSIAAYAVGAALFLGQGKFAAVFFILIFSLINCMKVKNSGNLQTFLTVIKIFIILSLTIGLLFFGTGDLSHLELSTPHEWKGISSFAAAMLAALWAFDGWNNLPMVSGEIENPKRNIALALTLGTFIVLAIYLLINFAYFFGLPMSEVITSYSKFHPELIPVAQKAAETFLHNKAALFISLAFVISSLGAMNGSILTGSRVPYAIAQDGLFFASLGKLNHSTQVPVSSILIQALISIILALSGSFDQLTDYVVFASWIFYALGAGAVIKFTNKRFLPILFILCSLGLLLNTVIQDPKNSLIGLTLILLGIPAYFFFLKQKSSKNIT